MQMNPFAPDHHSHTWNSFNSVTVAFSPRSVIRALDVFPCKISIQRVKLSSGHTPRRPAPRFLCSSSHPPFFPPPFYPSLTRLLPPTPPCSHWFSSSCCFVNVITCERNSEEWSLVDHMRFLFLMAVSSSSLSENPSGTWTSVILSLQKC